MPPTPRGKIENFSDFSDFLLELHKENARTNDQLRTLLLDFSERLAINEMSMKNAESARLLLLENLGRLADKMDNLRDIPRELELIAKDVNELKTTVKSHEVIFNQVKGGWTVARWSWVVVASVVSFLISVGVNYFLKRG